MKTKVRAGDVKRVVRSFVLEIERAPDPYADAGYYDADANRYVFKGGIWNDSGGRSASGVTKAHVTALRAELRALGLRTAWDDVDALLTQAAMGGDLEDAMRRLADAQRDGARATTIEEAHEPLSAAERKRRSRAKRREAGFCIVCSARPALPECVTCAQCGQTANERARKRRERKGTT